LGLARLNEVEGREETYAVNPNTGLTPPASLPVKNLCILTNPLPSLSSPTLALSPDEPDEWRRRRCPLVGMLELERRRSASIISLSTLLLLFLSSSSSTLHSFTSLTHPSPFANAPCLSLPCPADRCDSLDRGVFVPVVCIPGHARST
jgi:hypothetical protein